MNMTLLPPESTSSPPTGGVVRSSRPSRSGMTLVELMVSLVIMTILVSLSFAGLTAARTSAKRARTATTIQKISQIILPYYEQYETRRPSITNSGVLAKMSRGREFVADAKQLAIRRLMTLEMPERLTDITEAFQVNGQRVTDKAYAKNYGTGGSQVIVSFPEMPPTARRYNSLLSTATRSVTSDELLHLIVTRGPVADPDVISHFRDDETRDTDGDGLPEFIDGWNRPIRFKRWPTGFVSPMQQIDGELRNVDTLISDKGHRLVPLIYSAGFDGSYDIEEAPGFSYSGFDFDPFRYDPNAPNPATSPINQGQASVRGEVVLVPRNLDPLTFTATRYVGTPISGAFLTVGSPRDTGSSDGETPNGVLESADNIHNHDMTW